MPERGNVTADSGCHLLNYVGCAVCGAVRSPGCVSMVDRSTEEDSDDDEEIVNFTHACAKCAHVVAHHYYSFSVDASKKTQEYTMSCLLCGHGAAVTSFAVPESRAASFPPAAAAVPDPLAAVPLTLQTVGWRPPPLSSTLSSAQEGAVVRDDEWDILDTSATTVKQAPTTAAAGGLAASGLAAGGFAAVTQLAESGDADDLAEDSSVRRPSRGELLASGDASSCRPGQVGLDLSSTLSSLMSRWQDDPKYQAMISAFEASE